MPQTAVNVGYTRSSSRFSEADGSGTIDVSISNPIATSFTVRAQGGKYHYYLCEGVIFAFTLFCCLISCGS